MALGGSADEPSDTAGMEARVSRQDRLEYVYALPLAHAEAFAEGVGAQLPLDPYYETWDELRPKRFVSTLYFDTPDQQIAAACAEGSENIKLRAREYYAPAGDSGVYREPELWLEIKRREGARTKKLRCNILVRELGELLEDGVMTHAAVASRLNRWGEPGDRVLAEILTLLRRLDGPLRPNCIAHYRRRAWQDEDARARVTIDTELSVYPPPDPSRFQVWGASLVEVVTSMEPLHELEHAIVEAKVEGAPPAWLEALLGEATLRSDFSKFLVASRVIGELKRTP